MFIKQVSVFLENEPGRLDEALRVLGDGGIDILSVSIADTADYGVLRMIIKDSEKAQKILKEAGFVSRIDDVMAVVVDNKVGSFRKVMQKLHDEGINVKYVYGLCIPTDGAPIAIRTSDQEKTASILEKENVRTLSPEDLPVH